MKWKLPKIKIKLPDHLFSKCTVLICLGFIIWYVIASMNGYYELKLEPTNLTPYVFGFFGTELCILAFKTIFTTKINSDSKNIEDIKLDIDEKLNIKNGGKEK